MPADALRASGIEAAYGPVRALFGVDLRVAPGELVGLCGPNGVGKSTLLRVLSGLHRPAAGRIELDGQDVTGTSAVRRVRLGLSTVVGQAAFGSLSVLDNLRLHGYALPAAQVRDAVDAALAVFPRLAQRAGQPASTLSGGERQMLALARALVQRPRVLLVDELSLGLAPIVVGGLLEMLRRLHATGMSILVVEQSVNVALSLVDRVYFMERGTIAAEHRPQELAARPELVRSLVLGGHA